MLRTNATDVRGVPDALALRVVLSASGEEGEGMEVRKARERALCYYAQEKVSQLSLSSLLYSFLV